MKTLKAITAAALTLMMCAGASAQTLQVKDFQLMKKDKTACAKATRKLNTDGKKFAVVKLALEGQQATCNADASVLTAQPDLAYIAAGSEKMTVTDPKTGASIEYTFPIKIKAGKTYLMNLVSEEAEPVVVEEPKEVVIPDQQFVLFTLEPANAVVEFNNETLLTKNGEAQKLSDVGTYEYTVSAKGYYPANGTVTINADQKSEVNVTLKPASGWVIVCDLGNEDLTGADIYVDGELQGKAPLKMGPFVGGTHKLLVAKDTYNNATSVVTVIDNDTVKVSPCLDPNFAVVTLRTEDKNADIWANGVKLGTGEWTGKLIAGAYSLESREIGYTSASINEEIKPQAEVITIDVPSPSPIYGKIIVTSYPAKAIVTLDGTEIGETPLYLPKVKYGEYKIEVKKCGYKPYFTTVKMDESMRINVTAEMEQAPCCKEECAEEAPKCEEACEKACEAAACEEAPACDTTACKEACEEAAAKCEAVCVDTTMCSDTCCKAAEVVCKCEAEQDAEKAAAAVAEMAEKAAEVAEKAEEVAEKAEEVADKAEEAAEKAEEATVEAPAETPAAE